MKYKHIVFDVDGTLVDNERAVIETWKETILQLTGRIYKTEELKFVMNIPDETTMKRLQMFDTKKAFRIWENNFKKHRNDVQLFNDIESVLTKLQKEGYTLGIVTSRTHRELNNDDTLKHVLPQFKYIICVSDVSQPKPSPIPLIAYLQKSKINPNEILFIGDSINDALCANAAKIDFAWAAWSNDNPTIASKAKYILHTPKDLFLQNILNK